MDQILVELNDDMTLGTLRELARTLGKRLVISLESGMSNEPQPAAPVGKRKRGRRKRQLTPAARAALAKNLVKARAARAAKKAASGTKRAKS